MPVRTRTRVPGNSVVLHLRPLHFAAGYSENPAFLQVLLDAGADPSVLYDKG